MAGNDRHPRGGHAPSFSLMSLFFFGGLLVLITAVLVAFSFQYPSEPDNAATVEAEALQGGMGLSLKDAVLLDQYASSGAGERIDTYHCVVGFGVANGQKVIASLRVPGEGALYETMRAYMDDEEAGLGDCKITFCATTAPLGGKLTEYLESYVDDTFGELAPYRVVPISLTPRGESAWEYTDSVLHERKICRVVGALCLLAGSAMLFVALKKRGL